MEKISIKGVKCDLHMHSYLSQFKDGKVVSENTLNKLDVLIDKLNENEVNICGISDHDSFSYSLYSELKKEEGRGSIKKVLPVVEFSVSYKRKSIVKPIHIICVFDDKNEDKLRNIEEVLRFVDNRPSYDFGESFSEDKFINLMAEIDLDVLCIAHQKQTLTSDYMPAANDANSLGKDSFNEFIFSEYFEAFEFRNRRNEVFNNTSKVNFTGDLLRFITGSDCHEWKAYPKYSSAKQNGSLSFTFLKCLPTFKGVALALTDDSRISLENNFFNLSNKYLQSIVIRSKGKTTQIPLSRGINAIIGDNSIGKSLLLHKITGYCKNDALSPLDEKVKNGYEEYLKENDIVISNTIEQTDIFEFDTQGEIRKKFNLGLLKQNAFFADKYPQDVDANLSLAKITEKIDDFVDSIKHKFAYDTKLKTIGSVTLPTETFNATSLTFINADDSGLKEKETTNNNINSAIIKALNSLNQLNKMLPPKEREEIEKQIDYINSLRSKYYAIDCNIKKELSTVNCINLVIKEQEESLSSIKSAKESDMGNFINAREALGDVISALLLEKSYVKDIKYDISEVKIEPNKRDYMNYIFVKRVECNAISNNYLKELLFHPLKKGKKINSTNITKEELISSISRYDEAIDPIEFYEKRIQEKIKEDFKNKSTIVQKSEDGEKTYSSGLNMQIYFDILATNKYKDGIYLIDQPEDDVSPRAIKKYLLRDFKIMSRNRQLILVTHNPQFVVNLDVDNVISIQKSEDGIEIVSGALEYESDKVNILSTVATSLDGGIETIRKRWKRYAKESRN